jgi:NAD(P)-dependent dehydrogenase (short-subunit alcohol dehydrogenase family)
MLNKKVKKESGAASQGLAAWFHNCNQPGSPDRSIRPVYNASKAGMHAFSMALRQQLLKCGIKVFEVVPPADE